MMAWDDCPAIEEGDGTLLLRSTVPLLPGGY
jgi:hypothetical protein